MNEHEKVKVQQANQLYQQASKFRMELILMGHAIIVENPTHSWLWELPMIAPILVHCVFVDLHACMYGSTRKKLTSLLTNETALLALAIQCDGQHSQEAWGLDSESNFNTAKESQYPKGLCEAYVHILVELCNEKGWMKEDTDVTSPPLMQPRGCKTPQLIPEFKTVKTVLLPSIPTLEFKKKITSIRWLTSHLVRNYLVLKQKRERTRRCSYVLGV